MNINCRKAAGADEPQIRALLEHARLPTESLGTNQTEFFVAEENGLIVGVAGFEYYGDDALLRSVAVFSDQRNKGVGSSFVDWMIARAKVQGMARIVLLTETAKRFFEKKGFVVVDRSLIVNAALKNSSEFTTLCPTSSTTMTLELR